VAASETETKGRHRVDRWRSFSADKHSLRRKLPFLGIRSGPLAAFAPGRKPHRRASLAPALLHLIQTQVGDKLRHSHELLQLHERQIRNVATGHPIGSLDQLFGTKGNRPGGGNNEQCGFRGEANYDDAIARAARELKPGLENPRPRNNLFRPAAPRQARNKMVDQIT
jgi:hypothetical protein